MFQVRGKKILAEEPQPPGAGWAGKVPGTGTSSLSTGLRGELDLPWGARERPPAPRASTPRSGKSPGWLRGGLGSAHALLHGCAGRVGLSPPAPAGCSGTQARRHARASTHGHAAARSNPSRSLLIPPLIGRIAPSQPAQVCLLLVSGQICARRFLVPQLRDASNSSAAAFQINPTPPASTNSELPTRSRLGQAGPGAEKPRQPQPTSARPHAAPRASGSHRGVR